MTLFGFLAVIIGCITAIIITWLLTKSTIRIKIEKDPPIPATPLAVVTSENTVPIPDTKQEKQEDIAATSMDAVIAAANRLMGIETATGEDGDGRED